MAITRKRNTQEKIKLYLNIFGEVDNLNVKVIGFICLKMFRLNAVAEKVQLKPWQKSF